MIKDSDIVAGSHFPPLLSYVEEQPTGQGGLHKRAGTGNMLRVAKCVPASLKEFVYSLIWNSHPFTPSRSFWAVL